MDKLFCAGITDENGMYTMRLEPAEDQNIFIKAKKEGYVTLTPSIIYKMSKKESQKIVLSLSPDLGVRWQGCRSLENGFFNRFNFSLMPPEWW